MSERTTGHLPLVIVDLDSPPLAPDDEHNWATQLSSAAELKEQKRWREACEAITPRIPSKFEERDTLRGI